MVLAQRERKARYASKNVCEAKAAPAQSGYAVTAIKASFLQVTRLTPFWCLRNWTATSPLPGRAFGQRREHAGLRHAGRQPRRQCSSPTPAALVTKDGLAALELAVDTGIAALCAEAVGVMDRPWP